MKGLYASNLVVENRVGVSGQLAVLALKSARPNGSTMLVCPMSILSVYPHTFPKIGYNALPDLQPVGNCVTTDFALAVGAAVPERVTTVAQFMEWCKANSDKASFATGATGSKLHFAGIKLGMESGVKLTHIGGRAQNSAKRSCGPASRQGRSTRSRRRLHNLMQSIVR
jgi:tripartite-type tricarboxylate transporter receptor subunit TctC